MLGIKEIWFLFNQIMSVEWQGKFLGWIYTIYRGPFLFSNFKVLCRIFKFWTVLNSWDHSALKLLKIFFFINYYLEVASLICNMLISFGITPNFRSNLPPLNNGLEKNAFSNLIMQITEWSELFKNVRNLKIRHILATVPPYIQVKDRLPPILLCYYAEAKHVLAKQSFCRLPRHGAIICMVITYFFLYITHLKFKLQLLIWYCLNETCHGSNNVKHTKRIK